MVLVSPSVRIFLSHLIYRQYNFVQYIEIRKCSLSLPNRKLFILKQIITISKDNKMNEIVCEGKLLQVEMLFLFFLLDIGNTIWLNAKWGRKGDQDLKIKNCFLEKIS